MRVSAFATPRAHFVVDQLLGSRELAFVRRVVSGLAGDLEIGRMLEHGREVVSRRKRNRVRWLGRGEASGAVLLRLLEPSVKKACTRFLAHHDEPLFELLPTARFGKVQLSAYRHGDYYRRHRDASIAAGLLNITVLYFLAADPGRPFRGGALALHHRGRTRTIAFADNRLVVFASSTVHEVTTVRALTRERRTPPLRFSLQIWPGPAEAK